MSGELDLLAALEAQTLDPAGFSHRDHLRAAWALLGPGQTPFADAYLRLRGGLQALTRKAGRPERYSETLTLGWLALVHEELERTGETGSFTAFEEASAGRLGRDALAVRYPAHGLDGQGARTGLVLPPPCVELVRP